MRAFDRVRVDVDVEFSFWEAGDGVDVPRPGAVVLGPDGGTGWKGKFTEGRSAFNLCGGDDVTIDVSHGGCPERCATGATLCSGGARGMWA